MKRRIVLGALLVVGVVSMAVASQRGGTPGTEGPRVVEVDKISDTLYVAKGGGGNTAVFLTAGGVVLVDTKLPGWGQPLLDKVKTISNRPVTMVIRYRRVNDSPGCSTSSS